MAGLVAAAEARRLGAEPLVVEKLRPARRVDAALERRHLAPPRVRALPGRVPGRRRAAAARCCSSGSTRTCAGSRRSARRSVARDTGNPLTTRRPLRSRAADGGARRRRAGGTCAIQCGTALTELPDDAPVVLATGGFGASRELLREHVTRRGRPRAPARRARQHRRRPAPRAGRRRRAERRPRRGLRSRDAGAARARRPRTTSCGSRSSTPRHAEVTNERGERLQRPHLVGDRRGAVDGPPAARPRLAHASSAPRSAERVRERSVGEMVDAAEAAGAPVRRDGDHVTVETVAGVTTTLGGLRIDGHARGRPGRVRLRGRRRRHRHRRLRERPGGGARVRPHRGRARSVRRRERGEVHAPPASSARPASLRQRRAVHASGIEEELLLVDADTLQLAHVADRIAAAGRAARGPRRPRGVPRRDRGALEPARGRGRGGRASSRRTAPRRARRARR